MPPAIAREHITGLVLAGGRGSRMGGVDKGRLAWQGGTLAQHALGRLQPQVGAVAISANRHLDDYRTLGVPVWPDTLPDFPGPLAGVLTGLRRCGTPWLASVPCDTPGFPADLVARLAAAAARAQAPVAVAARRATDGSVSPEPAFCLVDATLADALEAYLRAGQRRVRDWIARHGAVQVVFDQPGDDPQAFANANTPQGLARLGAAALRE